MIDTLFGLWETIYHRYFPLSLYEIQLLRIDQSNISILGNYTLNTKHNSDWPAWVALSHGSQGT